MEFVGCEVPLMNQISASSGSLLWLVESWSFSLAFVWFICLFLFLRSASLSNSSVQGQIVDGRGQVSLFRTPSLLPQLQHSYRTFWSSSWNLPAKVSFSPKPLTTLDPDKTHHSIIKIFSLWCETDFIRSFFLNLGVESWWCTFWPQLPEKMSWELYSNPLIQEQPGHHRETALTCSQILADWKVTDTGLLTHNL